MLSIDEDKKLYCTIEFIIPSNRALPEFTLKHETFLAYFLSTIAGIALGIFGYYDSRPGLLVIGILFVVFSIGAIIIDFFTKRKTKFDHKEFNRKYIVSSSNIDWMKRVFDHKLCGRIADYYDTFELIHSKNNLLTLDCLDNKIFEDSIDEKVDKFVKLDIDCAIIFNEQANSQQTVTNVSNMDLTLDKLTNYFLAQCRDKKAAPIESYSA